MISTEGISKSTKQKQRKKNSTNLHKPISKMMVYYDLQPQHKHSNVRKLLLSIMSLFNISIYKNGEL